MLLVDPFARLVIVHMPVVWLYVPMVGVPAVYPVGSGSFICMLVACMVRCWLRLW